MSILRRFVAFFRKKILDRDMAEEMRFHLQQSAVTFGRNAAFTNAGTLRPYARAGYMASDGRPIAAPTEEVGPRYFETLGLRLLAGRDFRLSDDRNAPRVAAINEAAAREFFSRAKSFVRTTGDPAPLAPRTAAKVDPMIALRAD